MAGLRMTVERPFLSNLLVMCIVEFNSRACAKGGRLAAGRRRVILAAGTLCVLTAIAGFASASHAQSTTERFASGDAIGARVGFRSVTIAWTDQVAAPTRSQVEAVAVSAFSGTVAEVTFTAAMRRILTTLEDNGYRHARLSPRDFATRDHSLEFVLQVSPGPRSRVVSYGFDGLASTDTVWLKKLVAQPVDVPLTAQWLRIASARLHRLSNIRIAGAPDLIEVGEHPQTNETAVAVRWHLQENRNARFDGLLAAGGEGDQSGLNGRAAVQFDGLFGRDRSVAVRYYRLRPQWTSLNLRFAERGSFSGPVDWALELDESNQRDRRQRITGTLEYNLGPSANWKIGTAWSWQRITPGESDAANARLLDASAGVEKPSLTDSRAGVSQTNIGFGLWTTISRRRTFGSPASDHPGGADDRFRLDSKAGVTQFLASRWELGLSMAARWWWSGNEGLRYGDEWYLGGPDRLRGYEDQAFAAASGIWLLAEAGYWLLPSLGVTLFSETARFSEINSESNSSDHEPPFDYGCALRLASAGRIGRLEFAWRRDAALRDGFLRLKVTQTW